MKTKVIKTRDYAAALLPDGSVVDAGSWQELELKLACRPDAAETKTASFRLRGKKGMKEALLATVGSSEPGALHYAFCAAYLAKEQPALAYAYLAETAALGTADFLPGTEPKDSTDTVPHGCRRVQQALVEKILRHPLYRKVMEMIRYGIYGEIKGDWKDVHRAAQGLKWDGEEDGKEVLEAALANPALK